ncbi:MAG TPA: Gfo/Idh/MocA family oxidoreductase [Chloroflexota bacterium]
MDGKVRVGVIGTGFGKQHIRVFNAHPRSVVTAVASTDVTRAGEIAGQFGVPHAFGDYRSLLAEAPIDAVAVITPPAWHVPISLAALDAGKHVFCAKPLAVTLADAHALLNRARESKLVHAIDQQLRFAPPSLFIKELLEAGTIGRPLSLVNSFCLYLPTYFANSQASPNKNAWFARRNRSGGLFLANAPHELDRLLWLFGAVRSVTGRAHTAIPEVRLPDGTLVPCDADDSYHALLEFESGLMALTQCTPLGWPSLLGRLEIHGDSGSLLQQGWGDQPVLNLARATDRSYAEIKVPDRLTRRTAPEGLPGALYAIADRFLRAILDGEPMSPSFEDGYRTQELIEAVFRSSQTGQRQVLPLSA